MANVKATDLIDFTRASKGHALAKVSYGTELVTNGGFDTDSSWTKGSGWSIEGGVAVSDGGSTYTELSQSITSFDTDKVYKFSFDLVVNSGIARFFADGTAYENLTSSGTYEYIIKPTTTAFSPRIQSRSPAFDGTVDNFSVKEVLFDQPNGTIQLFEHPNNIPRIEYDSDGNLLGLLIEESRTNTIQYSEDFENSYWGKGGGFSIYGNHGIAPDGTRTATLITDADSDSYMVKSGGIASNGQTKSIWARTVSGTGKVTLLKHKSVSAALFDLTEEWQRFELPVDTSETGGSSVYAIDFRAAGTTLTEAYIWGAQLETGGFATSYIRSNSGSSTSRSADVASIDVDQFGYNQSEGTVTVEANAPDGSNQNRLTQLVTSGGATNRVVDLYRVTNDIVMYNGTTTITGNAFAASNDIKAAGAYKSGSYALVSDGGSVIANSDATVYIPNTLTIGMNGASSRQLNGHIKSITYTPKRLSNAKLQELTS